MKKILLWHIALGVVFEALLLTTMEIKKDAYTLILTVVFMVIASAGYLHFGAKEYGKKTFITAGILLVMTLVAKFLINPFCISVLGGHPISCLLLFPYGGAETFIKFGVYLAIKQIYFGVILGSIALFIPSVLTLLGAWIGKRMDEKKQSTQE